MPVNRVHRICPSFSCTAMAMVEVVKGTGFWNLLPATMALVADLWFLLHFGKRAATSWMIIVISVQAHLQSSVVLLAWMVLCH